MNSPLPPHPGILAPMRRCAIALLVVCCALVPACQRRSAVADPPPHAPSLFDNCPLADPILDDIPAPTRSSIEEPLQRARMKPYEDWTEYDRGVAAKYLSVHYPRLEEAEVLGAVFSTISIPPESGFRQWLRLRAFSPGLVIFLLRNYTTLSREAINDLVRAELAVSPGGARFAAWLEIAVHFDSSPALTRHVVDLLLDAGQPLAQGQSCRYGRWCHDHLVPDLSPLEAADTIRAFAAQGRDIGPLFPGAASIFATDPEVFLREAGERSLQGIIAARLLTSSGDLERIGVFLLDSAVAEDIRAYWAYRIAADPPPGSAGLLARLRAAARPGSLLAQALSAPGTLPAPYQSCADRVALLKQRGP